MADNRFDLELGLNFSKVTEALQQIKSQFTGTGAEFQKIANKFKDSFNTMTNAIKLYGKESSQAVTATKAMERAMVELTKNGVDPTSASFKQLQSQIGPLATKMKGAGDSVKKSNMQWTNWALVLQDLPYGFRGIQNNLPALMGNIAGMAGPLYLVGSAVIAFFTAWDNGIISFGKSTKLAEDYSKQFATTLTQESIKFKSLYRVATDANTSMNERIKAAKILKEEYPGLLTQYSEEEIALGKAKVAFDKLSVSVIKYAKAQAAISVVTDLTKEQLIIEGERAELLDKFVKDPLTNYSKAERANTKGASPYNVALTYRVNILKQLASRYNDLQKKIDVYTKVLDKNVTAESDLNDFKGKVDSTKAADAAAKKVIETQQKVDEQILQDKINNKKLELSLYKDDAYKKYEISLDLLKLEEKLGLLKIQNGEYTSTQQAALQIGIYEEYAANLILIDKQMQEELLSNDAKAYKERIARGQKSYQDSIKTVSEFYKNKMNFATSDKNEQLAILKEEQAYFDILYGFNLISYGDYVKKTAEITKQQIALNNALIKSSVQATMQLGMAIMSALAPAFDMMIDKGASIGEALESVFTGLLKQLAKVIVTAAIAVALMAALGLINVSAIGSTFKMLVSQGMGLPKMGAGGGSSQPMTMFDEFASGGIISGPTYGLMGEYPGAQNNPEVVAPLDKLKDMIGGGGGGTFMLRGQDLLLSVNRAQKASNLKGQNISLV